MYLMEKALNIKEVMFLLSCHSVTFIDSLSPLPSPPLPNIPHMRRSNKLPKQQQQLNVSSQRLSLSGTRRINMQKFTNRNPCPE